jgi:hypothetical protein
VSSSRWTVDNRHIARVQQRGINIEVAPIDKFFRLRMNGKLGKLAFASELEAKIKAFEVIDSGAAVRYLNRLGNRRREIDLGSSDVTHR